MLSSFVRFLFFIFQLELGQNGVTFLNVQKHVAQASSQELDCVMEDFALAIKNKQWSVTEKNVKQVNLTL